MHRFARFFLLGGFVFLLFVLFSYLVHKDFFVHLDFDTTVKLQDRIPRTFDEPFSVLSDVGKFEISLLVLLFFLVVTRRLVFGLVAFGMFGLFHVIELFGKYAVTHPPPPEFMIRTQHIMDFPQFHVRADFSYPSGHAARALFLTIIFGYFVVSSKRLPAGRQGLSKNQKIILLGLLYIYDSSMLVSRVYLGEHWVTDVIGGVLLGGSLALVAIAFSRIRLFKKKQ